MLEWELVVLTLFSHLLGLLDFFAAGASFGFSAAAGRFLLAAAGCAVECAVRT